MATQASTKTAARQAVWDRLQREGLARFPFPPHGRIPNFQGAREAALRLFEIEPWATAKRLKVNPDAPQRYVREEALRRESHSTFPPHVYGPVFTDWIPRRSRVRSLPRPRACPEDGSGRNPFPFGPCPTWMPSSVDRWR